MGDINFSDAILTINGNGCPAPSATSGSYGACGASDPEVQDPQLGVLQAPNRLEWTAVEVPVPGENCPGFEGLGCLFGECFPVATVIRISGLRAIPAPGATTVALSMTGPTRVYPSNSFLTVAEQSEAPAEPYDNPPTTEIGTITCTGSANPAAVDPAGTSERVGPVLLECTTVPPPGGVLAAASFQFDLSVSLNVDLAGTTVPGPNGSTLTQASLVVDGDQTNAVTGELEAPNEVRFQGVILPIPAGSAPSIVRLSIEGLFANVSQLGVPQLAVFPSTQVTAFVGIGGANLPVTNNVMNVSVPIGSNPDPTVDLPIPMGCTATAVPPVIRAEGVAELTGDLVLACTRNGLPGGEISSFKADISLSRNVNINNNTGFAEPDLTDAVLVVNENNCMSPASTAGQHATCGAPFAQFQDPRFGRLTAPNRITWTDVEIPVPGFAPSGEGAPDPNPLVTTLRLTNVRAFAGQLGVPSAPTFPSTQVTGFVGIGKTTSLTTNNNALNMAVQIRGLVSNLESGPASGSSCVNLALNATLRLAEGYATPFMTEGQRTFFPASAQVETGYFAPGSNNGGGASQATRFLLRFAGVQQGVSVRIPEHIDLGGPASEPSDEIELCLLQGTDARGAGGILSTGEELQEVLLSDGAGIAVYELLDTDSFRIESVDIPIQASWPASPDVRPGQATVTALFAPLSNTNFASGPEPEPRFLDTGGDEVFLELSGADCYEPASLGVFTGWGAPGWTPIVADWDGDGDADLGVYSNGLWYIDANGNGVFDGSADTRSWGAPGWTPVTGNWQ